MQNRSWQLVGLRSANLVLLLALLACDDKAQRERAEAGRVLRNLEVVRNAPNENKRRPAEELAHSVCTAPVVCSARDSCADAYLHLATGTEAALRVKHELDLLEASPDAGPEKMGQMAEELDRADREINGAKDSLRKCEEAASNMRRAYGI
jgi:hypothetical protein